MRQFSVTCSNVFSNQSASSFENELAQSLDFGRANKEDWRVSLAELAYTPHQFHNIRANNNRMDIRIRDWYYPIYSPIMWNTRDGRSLKNPNILPCHA